VTAGPCYTQPHMPTPADIKHWIEQGLPSARVAVEGDGRHFRAVVVCAAFAGKPPVERHKMVYAALGDRQADIHALSMRTLTPEQQP